MMQLSKKEQNDTVGIKEKKLVVPYYKTLCMLNFDLENTPQKMRETINNRKNS